jgi:hypothetical protein
VDEATRRVLFGSAEAVPEVIELRAGALRLGLQGTRLLALHADGHEVWHGLAFVYRDPDWGTPEPVVDALARLPAADGFSLEIRAHIPAASRIDLCIRLSGDAKGRVRYEATACPEQDIAGNRMGLCLMHPLSAIGRAVEIEHDDGRASRSTLPRLVAPWPPFTGVRAIRHEFADGAWAACRLEGEVFEFEDQRNNADASFKTYSRSNFMPRPYLMRAGVPCRQAAELWLETRAPPRRACVSALSFEAATAAWPRLGLGLAPADLACGERLLPLVRGLAPVQLHLVLDSVDDPIDLGLLARCVAASALPLRLDIRAAAVAGLPALAKALGERAIGIEALAAFPASPPMVEAARSAFGPPAIGGGTPYFFAQLNRLEDLGPVDFLSFTTCAIVHGADDLAPMAGHRSLAGLIETARARHPGLALRVGPSGIAAPRSPLGGQPASDDLHRVALARSDPRSGALYGAAWLVGHLAALAPLGLQAVSVLGLGPGDGLFSDEGGELRPGPGWFVLRELRHARRLRVARPTSEDAVAALALEGGTDGEVLLVAHLGAAPLELAVQGLPDGDPEVLDADAWNEFRSGRRAHPWRPLAVERPGSWRLPPYAVVRLRLAPVRG